MENKCEVPPQPTAVIGELVARSHAALVEDLEVGEAPALYVNKAFARAVLREMKMDHGASVSEEQMDDPKHFSVCGLFVFVNDKMFPSDENHQNHYAAVFRRCL